jgi:hypothetical protein
MLNLSLQLARGLLRDLVSPNDRPAPKWHRVAERRTGDPDDDRRLFGEGIDLDLRLPTGTYYPPGIPTLTELRRRRNKDLNLDLVGFQTRNLI